MNCISHSHMSRESLPIFNSLLPNAFILSKTASFISTTATTNNNNNDSNATMMMLMCHEHWIRVVYFHGTQVHHDERWWKREGEWEKFNGWLRNKMIAFFSPPANNQ